MRGVFFIMDITLIITSAGAATATAAAFAAACAATFSVRVTAFGVGAADCKPLTMLRVVHEINGSIAQIINGDVINNNLYAIGVKGCINIAEVIIQRHAEIHAATSAA